MTKICGFTCEYNKNGICQKTMCVKHTYVTFGTRQAGKTLYNKVLEKNKELQERIDKAIKFINTHDLYHLTNEVILLSILKGSDSNEFNQSNKT